jgi:hypothetical protein
MAKEPLGVQSRRKEGRLKSKNAVSFLRNRRGQFVIEAVLLMVLSVGLLMGGLKLLRDAKVVSNLVDGPWERVAGMIESGSWQEPAAAAALHPNQRSRSLSLKPK